MTLPQRSESITDHHAEPVGELKTFGPASLRRVANLNVLKLSGSQYDMGRQHGALLKQEVRRGPVPYYRTYIRKMLRNTGLGALSPVAAGLIKQLVGRRVARNLPEFATEAIRGLADGAELGYRELLDGCVMPDSLMWCAAKTMKVRGIDPAVQHRLSLGLGCSSAIAWGDATADGKMLHARNVDYHGVESWPGTAAVLFHAPDVGQRYVSVAAAGIPLGGATAMNAAGLTLTVHQHMFTDATRLGGMPIGVLGDVIMREATCLDDAQQILERHRPIGCWTYLITDGQKREMMCFEENPDRQVAHRIDTSSGTFGYANIYLDPELGATERNLYGSYWRANLGRQERMTQRLVDGAGSLDPDSMASILADTGDTDCRLHRAAAMLMTVASVVFSPEDGLVWVATGDTPVCHNAFEPFALATGDHAPERGRLTGGIPGDRDSADAFEAYRKAYLAYFEDNDVTGSRALIDRAIELQPKQALYHVLAGLLAVSEADGADALVRFNRALELGHPDPERIATCHLWRGRAADLLGRREDAIADYHATLALPTDPPVGHAAHKGLRRRYTKRKARGIAVDFVYADIVAA